MIEDEILDRQLWKSNLLLRAHRLWKAGDRSVTFSVYRRGDISATHTPEQVNPPEEVQFDGVIFNDGTCVIHWNTAVKSTAVFASFDELLEIHGHPEENYATQVLFQGEN